MKITNATVTDIYKHEANVKKVDIVKEEKASAKKIEQPKDHIDIAVLKEEADKAYAQLRTIVEDLLKRQGHEFSAIKDLKPEDIKVDQQARDEAKQMIEDGGPLSPEKVSDRILNFAKSISSNDKGKIDLLKKAINEGFDQAKKALGGELPEISQTTYDLIQEKFDQWENES